MPGSAEVNLQLPVAEHSQPAKERPFEMWRERVPRAVDALGEVESVTVGTTASTGGPGFDVTIKVVWQPKPLKVEFFPAPANGVLVSHLKMNESEGMTVISFQAKRAEQTAGAVVEGVVAFTPAEGPRRGFPVTAVLASDPGVASAGGEEIDP
jgi:hypothetical protein